MNIFAKDQPADGTLKNMTIKIAIVEDDVRVRGSLARLIDSTEGFCCVSQHPSAENALIELLVTRPDVVLMDIFLPRMSGIECTAKLKALLPKTQIIILTAMDDEELVFMALEAGADGYLLKRTKPEDLRAALLDVLGGGAPMTSEIARRVIEAFRGKGKTADESLRLSVREEQILVLLTKGCSNKMIADRLEISAGTVGHHMKHVFEKMHVSSRTEAVVRYLASKNSTSV